MRTVSILTCAALLAATGCKSESKHFPAEEQRASQAVKAAKRAGADQHSADTLAASRRAVADAQAAETAAVKEQDDASAQLRAAEKREREVERRVTSKRAELRGAEAVRDEQDRSIQELEARREELLKRGASEADLSQGVDPNLQLARTRVRSDHTLVAMLTQEVSLVELEQEQVAQMKSYATARLKTADQRLNLSRALYARAEDLAKLAQAESLDADRARISNAGP